MIVVQLGTYSIHVSDEVLHLLSTFKQLKKGQNESGGILLGQVKGSNIYILRITVPSVYDKATRTSFIRDKNRAQIIIDHEFVNSNNKTIYLGEWHTHPEKYPSSSPVDIKMIRDQYKSNKLNEPYLIFLIQGTDGFYLGKFEGEKIDGISIKEEK